MKIKEIINKARSFAERNLYSIFQSADKDDYFLFQISKFLLLKEYVIKKDFKNKTLYFDYAKNSMYLPSIMYVVDYVRNNGKILSNNLNVIIKNSDGIKSNNLKIIEDYIRDFHKIRDSIAHGGYDIDSENGLICIKNNNVNIENSELKEIFDSGSYKIDYKEKCIILDNGEKISFDSDTYIIECDLPIEILELFSYISENPKRNYNNKDMALFNNKINKYRKKYNYYNYIDIKKLNDIKKYFNNYKNNDIKNHINKNATNNFEIILKNYEKYLEKKEIKDFIKSLNDSQNKNINNNINNYIDNDKYQNIKNNYYKYINNNTINKNLNDLNNVNIDIKNSNYSSKNKDLFLLLSKLLKNVDYLSSNEKKRIDKYLEFLGVPDLGANFPKKYNNTKVNELVRKLSIAIGEMSSITGIKKNDDEITKIAAIYNYMQLFLSFNWDSFEMDKNKAYEYFKCLKISKLNPDFKGNNQDREIVNKISNITKKLIKAVSQIDGLYHSRTIDEVTNILRETLNTYYKNISTYLGIRNFNVFSAIRNAIDHGGITEDLADPSKIYLYDMSDQSDNTQESINFSCSATPEDFFELTKKIESNMEGQEQSFSDSDLLEELKLILSSDLYGKLEDALRIVYGRLLADQVKRLSQRKQ